MSRTLPHVRPSLLPVPRRQDSRALYQGWRTERQLNSANCALKQKFGRFQEVIEPGLTLLNPLSESVRVVNLQTQTMELDQTVLTKDNITCRILTVIFYRVIDPALYEYRLGPRVQ